MAKSKATAFFCKECGYESAKWNGQCPSCKAWNTFVEAPVIKEEKAAGRISLDGAGRVKFAAPKKLEEIDASAEERIPTGFSELDNVLGGGIVPASLVLVGGDPGIGKSTLLLQACANIAASGRKVLYVSGEESLKQIKLRADRIGKIGGDMLFLSENNLDMIAAALQNEMPALAVIDSIQTVYRDEVSGAPGSISQVRESTSVLLQVAKGLGIAVFIVGHVTKDGQVAGPRMLEHMVDAVLYFEGDKSTAYRIVRSVKNRFGRTDEIGVFEMREEGLREVANPSEYMLSGGADDATGSVVTCSLEGSRPMLLEIQALVCRSGFGQPRRTASGADYNRVNLLIAVLEKRENFKLSECDAYVNIAGGMKISEPSLDLGIVMALASSYLDLHIDSKTLIFGEVGLSGEVRPVRMAQQRVAEAVKMGFETVILPEANLKGLDKNPEIRLVGVSNIAQAMRYIQK
ncbi:MAG: DNA repair protein RadA [Lachnospiraceae bacterium]|nr:DNA repair protein RadA [Lachnospiraceae bacterium]